MKPWLLALVVTVAVSATSFGIHRWMVSQAAEEGAPKAAERAEQRRAFAEQAAAADSAARRDSSLSVLLAELEDSITTHTTDSMLIVSAGNIAYRLRRWSTAEKHYRAFLNNIDSRNAEVRIDLAYCVFQQDRPDEAITMLKSVVDRDPQNQMAMFNLGVMYVQMNNPDEAKVWFIKCRNANPATEIGQRAANAITSLETTS